MTSNPALEQKCCHLCMSLQCRTPERLNILYSKEGFLLIQALSSKYNSFYHGKSKLICGYGSFCTIFHSFARHLKIMVVFMSDVYLYNKQYQVSYMNWYACYLLNSITQNKHCFANFSSITCYYTLCEHECDNWLLKLCSLKCWNRLLVVACYQASTRSLLQMLKLRGGVSCRCV